jgi:hypothetical protein
MINLRDFIKETIEQLIDGVADAKEHAETKNAYINVPTIHYAGGMIRINKDSLPEPQLVEFDIAVTTSEVKDIKGGVGIFVAGVGLGYQANKGTTGGEISRIKFSIPVILPTHIKLEDVYDSNPPIMS